MEAILEALADQQAELTALIDAAAPSGWALPSACAGWSVADVVLHLAQTNEMATASARGDLPAALARLGAGLPPAADIDDGAALMVANERGAPATALRERWVASCDELRSSLAAHDPADRLLWVAGDLAARSLATTRLAETWIHTGDVAEGLGRPVAPTDRLWHVARLAWRTIPYAFSRAGRPTPGPVAFELTAPSGSEWSFGAPAPTVISGPAVDLCRVASRRLAPSATGLRGEGPDAAEVLELVRTWA